MKKRRFSRARRKPGAPRLPFGVVKKRYYREDPPQDYLKYFRTYRIYICKKYNLTLAELEFLLFLYSEMYFSKGRFEEFEKIIYGWSRKRLLGLIERGLVSIFRSRGYKQKELYELSPKGKSICKLLYDSLAGKALDYKILDNDKSTKMELRHAKMVREINKRRKVESALLKRMEEQGEEYIYNYIPDDLQADHQEWLEENSNVRRPRPESE